MAAHDTITNAIYDGIKRGIKVCIDNECFGSAVILIYSGIDSMAYLGMPAGQTDVTRKDFIDWADRYIKFPCKEQLTGADMYGARCGMLHNYSVYSNMSHSGQCRIVGYMDKAIPEVIYNPAVNKSMVLVSVPALAEAFFRGIDQSLVDVFLDNAKAQVVEARMKNLVQCLPVEHE